MQERFKIPVSIDNDANCAALAELKLGYCKKFDNSLMYVIGTGIGGSIIINKEIYRGSNFFAGEYGSMYEAGLPKFLKNKTKALAYKCNSFYGTYFTALKYKILAQKEKSCREIYELYYEDKIARKVVNEMVFGISKTIANISLILDPQVIIIGGAISENKIFLEMLKKQFDKFYEIFKIDKKIEIRKSNFGNDANILGASLLD